MADVAKWLTEGRYDLLSAHARSVLETDPGDIEALYYAGFSAFYQNHIDEARLHLRKAALLAPESPDIQHALGLCLLVGGDAQDALPYFQRAVRLSPSFAQAYGNLAQAYADIGNTDEALTAYDAAIAADAGYAQAYVGKGDMMWRLNRPDEALACYQTALERRPDFAVAYYKAATLLPRMPSSDAEIVKWRDHMGQSVAALTVAPHSLTDPAREVGRTQFYITYHGLNDRSLQTAIAGMYRAACPQLDYVAPHCRDGAVRATVEGRKIRIAFISAYLGQHTIGDLNRLLIAGLPRDRFDVTIYCVGTPTAANLALMESCADRVVVLPVGLKEMQTRIAADEPDVAYFPEIGMSPETYFLAYARLAPVQCTTWGHPETSGLRHMDYFITMDDAELLDIEDHYSETPVRMPRTVKFPEPPSLRSSYSRQELGLHEDGRLYVCLQSPFKIHHDMDPMLAGILRADPQAHIYLLDGKEAFWAQDLRARLKRTAGDDVERLHFLKSMAHDKFQAVMSLADVLLDPPHFGGGKTTLESLWLDRPVVTLPSPFLRARLSLAFYRQIGVEDCLVDTPEAFVEKAVRIANDPDYRAMLVDKITRNKATLFNNDQAIEAHTTFFENVVEGKR